jgi:hypothetical protein
VWLALLVAACPQTFIQCVLCPHPGRNGPQGQSLTCVLAVTLQHPNRPTAAAIPTAHVVACRCRFVAPGKPAPPPPQTVPFSHDPYSLIFNGQCMFQIREALLAVVNQPATNLTRPGNGTAANPSPLLTSLGETFKFFQLQWAGTLPHTLPDWRQPGFVKLDEQSCRGNTYDTSFATGSASFVSHLIFALSSSCLHGRVAAHSSRDQAPALDRAGLGPRLLRAAMPLCDLEQRAARVHAAACPRQALLHAVRTEVSVANACSPHSLAGLMHVRLLPACRVICARTRPTPDQQNTKRCSLNAVQTTS